MIGNKTASLVHNNGLQIIIVKWRANTIPNQTIQRDQKGQHTKKQHRTHRVCSKQKNAALEILSCDSFCIGI